jgi:UDP-glucuronate decarboxylase
LNEGHRVTALDNFYTGTRKNVDHLFANRRFQLIEHDVADPWPAPGHDIDYIFNLACPASPVHYQRDPIFTVRTSVLGALHGLDLARSVGARFVQASTSEVYGDPLVHPQKEDYWGNVNPIGVRACYDESKRCAETVCFDYHRQHDVEIRVARIFNTYGPRMAPDDGRVVSNFVLQALRGERLTIYGDGTQTRSFCYVADLVDGLLKLSRHPSEIGPVNLGNPEEIPVGDLAREVIALVGGSLEVEHRPLPPDDPKRRRPDITRAHEVLGFCPRIRWQDGLAKTIEHFRSILGKERLPQR